MKSTVFLTYGIISINLLIAFFMLLVLSSDGMNAIFEFLAKASPYLFVGILSIYFSGKYISFWMNSIIKKTRILALPIGVLGLFLMLTTGIFSGSSLAFMVHGIREIQEGSRLGDILFDYYGKPFLLIILFGFIPTFLTGGFLGYLIKKN